MDPVIEDKKQAVNEKLLECDREIEKIKAQIKESFGKDKIDG